MFMTDLLRLGIYDLIFVFSAAIFNLSIIGVYISSKNQRFDLTRKFGSFTIALAIPLAAVYIHYWTTGKESWMLLAMGAIFLYLFVELLLDFILKIDFRKMLVAHILYIVLFYIALFSFIRISFAIHETWGYIVSVLFWILLASLIYSLRGSKTKEAGT